MYDIPCKRWRHIERQDPRLLTNKEGILRRLPASRLTTTLLSALDGNILIGLTACDVAMQPIGRVYLSELAHLGYHDLSLPFGGRKSSTEVPEEIHMKHGAMDVYALKDASLPKSCSASQLVVYKFLFGASNECKKASRLVSSPILAEAMADWFKRGLGS